MTAVPAILALYLTTIPHKPPPLKTPKPPPPPPSRLPRSLFLIPLAIYLYRVHSTEPRYQTHQRIRAQRQGLSVTTFRDDERWQIDRFWTPYARFFARRNLEKECEVLSRWQNLKRRREGEPELPVYRPVDVEDEWTPYLQAMAKGGPKGPNHWYTMIRE